MMKITGTKTIRIHLFKLLLPLFAILFIQAIIKAQAPPNTVLCAKEGQVCSFDGEKEVMYGANGTFITKTIKGNSACLARTFDGRDPVPNVVKSCYIVNTQLPNDAVLCAKDGQICSFDGEKDVMYGANGVFIRKTIRGGSVCLPRSFDGRDPVPNVVKGCYILGAQGSAQTSNLSGSWVSFDGRGTAGTKLATITQSGTSLTFDNGLGSQSSGSLSGNAISTSRWGVTGTLSENGTKISWSNNTTWVKQIAPPTPNPKPAPQPAPVSSVDLSGTWKAYSANGTAAPKLGTITQKSGGYIIDNGQGSMAFGEMNGSNSIIAGDWQIGGTISENGTKISWSNNTTWVKQSSSVGGGDPAPINDPVGAKLVGDWTCYDEIGRVYLSLCKIYYSGSTLTIDNGQGSKSTLRAATGMIKAENWNMVGTIPADASVIDWSNGGNSEGTTVISIGTYLNSLWVKNTGKKKDGDVTVATEIPNLIGYWTAYSEKGVKESSPIYIYQHLYQIKYKSGSGSYGVADLDVRKDGTILTTPINFTLGVTTSHGATVSADGKKIVWDTGKYWVKN